MEVAAAPRGRSVHPFSGGMACRSDCPEMCGQGCAWLSAALKSGALLGAAKGLLARTRSYAAVSWSPGKRSGAWLGYDPQLSGSGVVRG